MNIFANFDKADALLYEQVDPSYRPFLRQTITRLKQAALPSSRRNAFVSELLTQCRSHTLVKTEAEQRCHTFIREERAKLSTLQKLVLRFSDLPMILFLYAGFYEVALDHLLGALIEKEAIHWVFPLTLSLLVNTLILYIVMQALLLLLARADSTLSLYYWLILLGGFLVFLGLTYLSRTYLDIPLCNCSTIGFIAVTALLAWGAFALYRVYDR